MGLRFRKSINFGIFRLNASKTGLGWSVGVPGARYTKMANGRSKTTASIPGTGISWVEESKKKEKTTQSANKSEFWSIVGEIFLILLAVFGTLFLLITTILEKGGKK